MEKTMNKSMVEANMSAKNFEKVKYVYVWPLRILEKNDRLAYILSLGKLLDYDKY
jgi:hypothetical protein